MVIFSLFSWWYTTGWLTLTHKCARQLQSVLKFFSVTQLLGSLFAPFRQISAGRVDGPIAVQLRAFGDRVFSRFIGAFIRLMLIVVGVAVMVLMAVFCLLFIVAWPALPLAPFIGLLFAGRGV